MPVIGKADPQTEQFYLLPADRKILLYDKMAVNAAAAASDGGIDTCGDMGRFVGECLRLTGGCPKPSRISDSAKIIWQSAHRPLRDIAQRSGEPL